MTDGIFISRPDLWGKLLEQKRQNIDAFDVAEVAFHINMGINQAIGIMNRMPAIDNRCIMLLEREVRHMSLKELRKERGMTQIQLAQMSGVNSRQIQRVENGESDIGNVTLRNALALAKALGVSVEDLLEE